MADGIPFGSYRLQRRLGRGGMAEVFLARRVGADGVEQRVALKRMLPHLSDSPELRAMFLDEAKLPAQLHHRNVVQIYEFGRVDDHDFIAMELVDGVDVAQLIGRASHKPVPFPLAARIFADVCAALDQAHHLRDPSGQPLGLVHRDVSPQNILVGYDGIVKLVDFGIAKAAFAAGRTAPGVFKGKYAYMSPEQVDGLPLDGRSDLFSAGVCLYELLTGKPLFRRDDITEAMREIRALQMAIEPERHRRDLPSGLAAIVRRALARSPEDRYPDAASMKLELERFAAADSAELATWLARELPPAPGSDGEEATERQELVLEAESDSDPIGLYEGDEDAATEEHEAPTQLRPRLPPPRKKKAYVALALGLFAVGIAVWALRPFFSRAAPPTVALEKPEPAPVVTQLAPATQAPATLPVKEPERTMPEPGLVTLRSVPRAKVYDGARLLGKTPLLRVKLAPGQHTLKFVNPGHPPKKRHLQVLAGEETRLSVELK
jgi:eukaryotic-like serine/threonine-protein kinase